MKSNTVRLGLGWVFLMLLTAAGTFYAADALDQRGGLDKYALQEKFGYARATIASVPSQTAGTQTGNAPPQTSSNSQITPYSGQNQQPQQSQPSTQLFQQTQQNQQPPSQQPPPQMNQHPPVQQYAPPPQMTQQQLYQQLRQQQLYQQQQAQLRQQQYSPPQPNQQPYTPPQQQQQSVPQQSGYSNPPRQSAPSMSPALRDRLTEVSSLAEATYAQWQPIKQSLQNMGQSLRPEIAGALSNLRRFTQQAQSLARQGDAAGAEHALDMAEKQIQILKDARE